MSDPDSDPDPDSDADIDDSPDSDADVDDIPDSHAGSGTDSGPTDGSSESDGPSDTDSSDPDESPRPEDVLETGSASDGPFQRPGDVDDEESRVLTYGVPFVAALLVAVGIAGVVLGGWGVVQPAVGGCDTTVISVSTQEQTDHRLANDEWAESVDRLEFEELTPAEQRAFTEALERPQREGTVEGEFAHRGAFRRGVVVTHEGTDRYATVASTNECLTVDPLLLPLGVVTLLVGFAAFAFLWYRFGARPPNDWDVQFWGR